MNPPKKRKLDSISNPDNGKRLKMTSLAEPGTLVQPPPPQQTTTITTIESNPAKSDTDPVQKKAGAKSKERGKGKEKEKEIPNDSLAKPPPARLRINKLVPPRPFPTVPTSVSATGPRSSHREGKNMICLTRKTSLATYMRRCKNVILDDGYKTLHLSAMGAAIPLLAQLICALPPILPFSQDEIRTEITTETVGVQDEVIPEDEDEDLTYRTREKSVLRVNFIIGDGQFVGDRTASRKYAGGKGVPKSYGRPPATNKGKKDSNIKDKGKRKTESTAVVYEEPEQEEFMDML